MLPQTQDILRTVEERTGVPVEVITDATVEGLAQVTMARPGIPAHLVRIRDPYQPADYLVAYQCGFILRLYDCPPADRFQFADADAGKREVWRLVGGEGGIARKLRLPDAVARQFGEQLRQGLLTQLRSLPIGMRIDRWIYDTYPELHDQQAEAFQSQNAQNAQSLTNEVKGVTPMRIYTAVVSMNAAFASFIDALQGDTAYGVVYRAATSAKHARTLLDLFDATPPDAIHDRTLVDAWAETLGIAAWYRWVELT